MNIEIANRLVNLRKSNNLSQEALAEKLGISRQAVSKWERAEASPDTDNLILLSRIYGVSLDELLKTEEEILRPLEEPEKESRGEIVSCDLPGQEAAGTDTDGGSKDEYVHVGFEGVHVKDAGGEVHVGWSGIHVDDKRGGDSVHVDRNGVYINGEKYDGNIFLKAGFPMATAICIVYLSIGCAFGAWHPGWLLFLLIPIWYSLLEAVKKRNAYCFAYPVLATLIFLCMGIFWYVWHPGWVIFLTIPLYYSMVSYFRTLKNRQGGERSDGKEAGMERKDDGYEE
ncbi:MAG: helix-turn-helix domain-containing protein [Lachnospiraceae bacterium]|nr:helix-turn-helix domain-containing protein [Lachnospiraceae bacterium]